MHVEQVLVSGFGGFYLGVVTLLLPLGELLLHRLVLPALGSLVRRYWLLHFYPWLFYLLHKIYFNSGGLTGCQINETIMVCISCSWWCPGTIAPSPPHLTVSLYLFNSGSNAWGEVDGPCWEDSPEIWIQLVEILTGMCVEFSWLCVTRARPSKLPRGFRNQYLDTARQFHMRYFLYRDVVRAGLVSLNMFMNF